VCRATLSPNSGNEAVAFTPRDVRLHNTHSWSRSSAEHPLMSNASEWIGNVGVLFDDAAWQGGLSQYRIGLLLISVCVSRYESTTIRCQGEFSVCKQA
jgi:hypothetical protein